MAFGEGHGNMIFSVHKNMVILTIFTGGGLSLELKEDSMKSSVGKNHLRMTCCCWNLYGRALRFIEFVIRKTGEKTTNGTV